MKIGRNRNSTEWKRKKRWMKLEFRKKMIICHQNIRPTLIKPISFISFCCCFSNHSTAWDTWYDRNVCVCPTEIFQQPLFKYSKIYAYEARLSIHSNDTLNPKFEWIFFILDNRLLFSSTSKNSFIFFPINLSFQSEFTVEMRHCDVCVNCVNIVIVTKRKIKTKTGKKHPKQHLESQRRIKQNEKFVSNNLICGSVKLCVCGETHCIDNWWAAMCVGALPSSEIAVRLRLFFWLNASKYTVCSMKGSLNRPMLNSHLKIVYRRKKG